MKKKRAKLTKETVDKVILHAEVAREFKDAARQRGTESAFLKIRRQETGRGE